MHTIKHAMELVLASKNYATVMHIGSFPIHSRDSIKEMEEAKDPEGYDSLYERGNGFNPKQIKRGGPSGYYGYGEDAYNKRNVNR